MGWVGEYPRVRLWHVHSARTRLVGQEVELTVSTTPIAVRRPARGVTHATVECRACGDVLEVGVRSASATRTVKVLLLLLGIFAGVVAVLFFLSTPIMTEYKTTAEYDAAGWSILGLCVSGGLVIGMLVGCRTFDGVWLRRGGGPHRLTY